MYTGNHRDEEWKRYASQMIAKVKQDGSIEKLNKPVIAHQLKDIQVILEIQKYLSIMKNIMQY